MPAGRRADDRVADQCAQCAVAESAFEVFRAWAGDVADALDCPEEDNGAGGIDGDAAAGIVDVAVDRGRASAGDGDFAGVSEVGVDVGFAGAELHRAEVIELGSVKSSPAIDQAGIDEGGCRRVELAALEVELAAEAWLAGIHEDFGVGGNDDLARAVAYGVGQDQRSAHRFNDAVVRDRTGEQALPLDGAGSPTGAGCSVGDRSALQSGG